MHASVTDVHRNRLLCFPSNTVRMYSTHREGAAWAACSADSPAERASHEGEETSSRLKLALKLGLELEAKVVDKQASHPSHFRFPVEFLAGCDLMRLIELIRLGGVGWVRRWWLLVWGQNWAVSSSSVLI